MPILAAEPDLYPEDLLDESASLLDQDAGWWAMYCLPRQEKQLMRRLRAVGVAHYCPLIAKRNRSPNGRIRTSYLPLFSAYVFVNGTDEQRHAAVSTGCVSRCLEVSDGKSLVGDLRQIHRLIVSGVRLTPEARFAAGKKVRITSGPFLGFEGFVIRRENETRLLVAVNYLQQGASMLLEDCQLEEI
jgi:transcription antitermination factor NusG